MSARPFFNTMQGRATTLTDVANRVLNLLGEQPITSIVTPNTDAGEKLKVSFYDSIDEVQGDFLWHELITTAEITADATDHYDGRKRYALPAACLRPLGVRWTGDGGLPSTTYTKAIQDEDEAYHVEGNWLLTYADGVEIAYIRREDDPTNWTAELLRCVVHCAAVNAGHSITDDPQIVANILQKYEQLVKPRAKLLQSKYKSNERLLPRGFTNLLARKL